MNKDSATIPNIGTEKLIDANHTDICRFKGKESPGYILLRDTLQGLAKEGQKFEPGPVGVPASKAIQIANMFLGSGHNHHHLRGRWCRGWETR